MLKEILGNKTCRKAASVLHEVVLCKKINDPVPEYCRDSVSHMTTCKHCSEFFKMLEKNPEIVEALDAQKKRGV